MEALNEYFNLTSVSTQLMKEKVPWRGGREKDYESMQILIEALRTPSFVALTGRSLHCQVDTTCGQSLLPLYYMPYIILKFMIFFLHIHNH